MDFAQVIWRIRQLRRNLLDGLSAAFRGSLDIFLTARTGCACGKTIIFQLLLK